MLRVGLRVMLSMMPEDMPRWISFGLDFRFLLFCSGITGAAAILFGLAPAVGSSRVDLRACLHEAGQRLSMLGSEARFTRNWPGPSPQLVSRIEQIRLLPRKEQEFVIRFLDSVMGKAGRT